MEAERRNVHGQASPLMALLLERAATGQVDVEVMRICRLTGGHVGEGTILLGHCLGRCARCGVGLVIPPA